MDSELSKTNPMGRVRSLGPGILSNTPERAGGDWDEQRLSNPMEIEAQCQSNRNSSNHRQTLHGWTQDQRRTHTYGQGDAKGHSMTAARVTKIEETSSKNVG